MGHRPLPPSASAALDIIVATGSRQIRANDLALRMHQRGFAARAVGEALKAFDRRGWLIQSDRIIEISEEAINARPAARKKAPPSKRKHTFLPRGLFSR